MNDTTAPRRGLRLIAMTIAAAAVTILTLAPRSLVAPARGAVMRIMDAVTAPLLVWIPYDDAERLLNTILFVPLGATIALLLGRRAWPAAMLVGVVLSVAVEYAQGSIPGRVPDAEDVLWNSVGGAIGVIAVTIPRLIAAAARRTAVRRTAARRSAQRGRVTRT